MGPVLAARSEIGRHADSMSVYSSTSAAARGCRRSDTEVEQVLTADHHAALRQGSEARTWPVLRRPGRGGVPHPEHARCRSGRTSASRMLPSRMLLRLPRRANRGNRHMGRAREAITTRRDSDDESCCLSVQAPQTRDRSDKAAGIPTADAGARTRHRAGRAGRQVESVAWAGEPTREAGRQVSVRRSRMLSTVRQISSSATTGTWSEGLSQPRTSLSMPTPAAGRRPAARAAGGRCGCRGSSARRPPDSPRRCRRPRPSVVARRRRSGPDTSARGTGARSRQEQRVVQPGLRVVASSRSGITLKSPASTSGSSVRAARARGRRAAPSRRSL